MKKKILILTANPNHTTKLRIDWEVREIKQALRSSQNRDDFEIVSEWAVRIDDLQSALLENLKPAIVHFSGHGLSTEGIVLESVTGQGETSVVSSQALAKLFKPFQNEIECIILNACYSDEQAEAIHQHIDCVIGMNRAVGEEAAIKFSCGFYDALGAGENYQICFEMGCTAMDLHGLLESQTPKIKIRNRPINPLLLTKKPGYLTKIISGFIMPSIFLLLMLGGFGWKIVITESRNNKAIIESLQYATIKQEPLYDKNKTSKVKITLGGISDFSNLSNYGIAPFARPDDAYQVWYFQEFSLLEPEEIVLASYLNEKVNQCFLYKTIVYKKNEKNPFKKYPPKSYPQEELNYIAVKISQNERFCLPN